MTENKFYPGFYDGQPIYSYLEEHPELRVKDQYNLDLTKLYIYKPLGGDIRLIKPMIVHDSPKFVGTSKYKNLWSDDFKCDDINCKKKHLKVNCTLSSYIVNSINTHSVPDVNTCNPLFIPSTTLAKMGDIAIYNIPTGMFNSNLLKYFVPPPNIQPGEDEDEDENEKNNTGGKQITKRKRQENKKKRTLRQHKKNKTLCKGTRRRRRLKQKKTSSLSLRN